jgi:hypothetical protein
VNIREFYAYRLFERPTDGYSKHWPTGYPNSENYILQAGYVFQQFVTDIACRIDDNRLRYQKTHQNDLRCDLYEEMQQHFDRNLSSSQRQAASEKRGAATILCKSFTGGPSWKFHCYQNAMAIAAKYGKPDYFITMTCNPKWDEITHELKPGETASDRPDIVSRVMAQKINRMIEELRVDQSFGELVGLVAVVEWQKRGLPHIHILVTVHPEDKLRTLEDIDSIVSAEIPDMYLNPKLHKIVTSNMIHGPCRATCLREDGTCSSGFPKDFRDVTDDANSTFVQLRRRSPAKGGHTFQQPSGRNVDNRWVVPYSPHLSLKYNCHINVELAKSIDVCAYLYKYINKGPDRVMAALVDPDEPRDQIREYVDSRLMGPMEACHLIFKFKRHFQWPPVLKLQIHLPRQNQVTFSPARLAQLTTEEEIDNYCNQQKRTMLTEYFRTVMIENISPLTDKQRKTDRYGELKPVAKNILYRDFPEFYTWNVRSKTWKRRIRYGTEVNIGRIRHCLIRGGDDLFYLRILLGKITGATCFEDYRTFNGVCIRPFTAPV